MVVEDQICITSSSCSGQAIVLKYAMQKIELYAFKPWEQPRVTNVTVNDTLDAKIA